jgi:hypothetical protein
MLHVMKAKKPKMHFKYVPKPEFIRSEERQYFLHAFWIFGQCVEAFKHCCDVLSIDVTFLTGKYECTMLIAIDIDVDCQLVPLVLPSWRRRTTVAGVGFFGWFEEWLLVHVVRFV